MLTCNLCGNIASDGVEYDKCSVCTHGLYFSKETVEYQKGWDDGYALLPMFSALLLSDEYYAGYNSGLDEAEGEGR